MEATLPTIKLKELLKLLGVQSYACICNISKSGIEIDLEDGGRTSMVHTLYSKDEFDEFKAPKKPQMIGIEPAALLDAIKFNPPYMPVTIVVDETSLTLIHDDFKDTIPLRSTDSIQQPRAPPSIDFTGKVTLDTKRLSKILKKSDDVTVFEIDDLLLKTKSDENPSISSSNTFTDTAKGTGKARFDTKQLLKVLKVIKSESIKLELKTDYPCKLTFKIGNSTASYFLAPRITPEA